MKKICILQNSMTFGGTDTFVINLCKGLVCDGYDVTVVLSADADENLPREKELASTGARITKTCHPRKILSKSRHLNLLYKELKKEKYDVFQTNIDLFNGVNLFVAWLAGVPVRECHSHNSEQSKELKYGKTLPVIIYQKLMRWMCWTFSNRRGGCSRLAMRFLFEDEWKNDPYSKVVHNGIELSAFDTVFDIEKKKEELGLTNKKNLCTVGRISHQKNPLFLVEILNDLFKTRDDCDFVWMGTGKLEDKVKTKLHEYGIEDRVHLIGARTDVSEVLRCCDLFLLPSLFEGLAIVLVEAQAARLSCLVSDKTPSEANSGGCQYLPIDKGTSVWVDSINKSLDGGLLLPIDSDKLNEYSIDYMVKEMEDLFE
ncbi:MAG: glycosyltransferase [Lachnospiraceae bacterium]|nr:glycosyltransferase [Lachnospiraceae bacterium]